MRRIVEIRGKPVTECGDARKLAIWNTGAGLSSAQLDHICDLAASLGKDMALEGNFGMGAKVASHPSNTLGVRYRSCREGVVSQVILGKCAMKANIGSTKTGRRSSSSATGRSGHGSGPLRRRPEAGPPVDHHRTVPPLLCPPTGRGNLLPRGYPPA